MSFGGVGIPKDEDFQGGSENRELEKLGPRYMEPYPMIKRVGLVAYQLSYRTNWKVFIRCSTFRYYENSFGNQNLLYKNRLAISTGIYYPNLFKDEVRQKSSTLDSGKNPLLVGRITSHAPVRASGIYVLEDHGPPELPLVVTGVRHTRPPSVRRQKAAATASSSPELTVDSIVDWTVDC
ncbi:unnamed protein product [Cochlearia groenlandica]